MSRCTGTYICRGAKGLTYVEVQGDEDVMQLSLPHGSKIKGPRHCVGYQHTRINRIHNHLEKITLQSPSLHMLTEKMHIENHGDNSNSTKILLAPDKAWPNLLHVMHICLLSPEL